jgi:hypothetical protein
MRKIGRINSTYEYQNDSSEKIREFPSPPVVSSISIKTIILKVKLGEDTTIT